MHTHFTTNRRKTRTMVAGRPLRPRGAGVSAAGLLSACGSDDTPLAPSAPPAFKSARFTSMAAPTLANAAAMATTTVGSALEVTYADGSTPTYTLAYQPFFINGDAVAGGDEGLLGHRGGLGRAGRIRGLECRSQRRAGHRGRLRPGGHGHRSYAGPL